MCIPVCGGPAQLMGASAHIFTPQVFAVDAIVQASVKISAFDYQLQLTACPSACQTSVH